MRAPGLCVPYLKASFMFLVLASPCSAPFSTRSPFFLLPPNLGFLLGLSSSSSAPLPAAPWSDDGSSSEHEDEDDFPPPALALAPAAADFRPLFLSTLAPAPAPSPAKPDPDSVPPAGTPSPTGEPSAPYTVAPTGMRALKWASPLSVSHTVHPEQAAKEPLRPGSTSSIATRLGVTAELRRRL